MAVRIVHSVQAQAQTSNDNKAIALFGLAENLIRVSGKYWLSCH